MHYCFRVTRYIFRGTPSGDFFLGGLCMKLASEHVSGKVFAIGGNVSRSGMTLALSPHAQATPQASACRDTFLPCLDMFCMNSTLCLDLARSQAV